MIQKLTISKISRNDKETNGKKWVSVGIKAVEHGDKWLNGFGNKRNAEWREGDVVKVEIEEKKVGDKVYLNFKEADVTSELIVRIEALETKFEKMAAALRPMYEVWKKTPRSSDGVPVPFTDPLSKESVDEAWNELVGTND